MNPPIYKLEGVVRQRSAEELQDFEGPLDLILFLLGKNKIEIQDISICLILEQYLEWISLRQELDLEVASEFITMAAHLMYIKTRMLLSLEDAEAQSEMEQLIRSLEERQHQDTYLRIKSVVGELEERSAFGRDTFLREPEPMEQKRRIVYDHQAEELRRAMEGLLERFGGAKPRLAALEEIVRQEPYSVREKASEILQQLQAMGTVQFLLLFRSSGSRSELVATFLAILELCRAGLLALGEEDDPMCTAISAEA